MSTSNKTLIALGIVAFAGMAMLTSCVKDNPDSPGFEYFPDMYRSGAPETNVAYASSYATDSMSNRLPADGSIPRGFVAFPYANNAMGDSLASRFWTYGSMGIKQSDENEEKGKELYKVYCSHCHGDKGDGNGKLVESGKYAAVPPSYLARYKENNLSEGHVYWVVTHGKGNMGSHALFLSPEERMLVCMYVQRLGRGGSAWSAYQQEMAKPAADSTNSDSLKIAGK